MERHNFHCPQCGRPFFIQHHVTKIIDGQAVSVEKKSGARPACTGKVGGIRHSLVYLVPTPVGGDYEVALGSSKADGKDKMVKYLKKRSKEHFKKEVAPIRAKMNRDSIPQH